jgi:hypothetical protein
MLQSACSSMAGNPFDDAICSPNEVSAIQASLLNAVIDANRRKPSYKPPARPYMVQNLLQGLYSLLVLHRVPSMRELSHARS